MEQNNKTHPLVIAAAVAVLVSSVLAAAVLTGVLPSATSKVAGGTALPSEVAAPARRAVPVATEQQRAPARKAACADCGVIESIQSVESSGPTSGVGAVAGGVAGAVVGNQFGRGAGRDAMTLLGAAGGALAGNAIEKNAKKQTSYRVVLRMDDGTRRTLTQPSPPVAGIGDRVRLSGGSTLERAS